MEIDALIAKAERLEELPGLIFEAWDRADLTSEYNEVESLLAEFRDTKKAIKIAFVEDPAATIPTYKHKHARKVLQHVVMGKPLPFEQVINNTPLKGIVDDELTMEEAGEIGDDHFHSWFSYYEYAYGMYEVGAIVAAVGSLPDLLLRYLQQVRQCFVLQQYLAVCSLCRTALELTLRDLYTLEGFNDPEADNYKMAEAYFSEKRRREGRDHKLKEDYDLGMADTRNILCKLARFDPFYWQIRNLQVDLNSVVHGNKSPSKSDCRPLLARTFMLIHDLYEA